VPKQGLEIRLVVDHQHMAGFGGGCGANRRNPFRMG
jgi:hypothetical protein